MAPDVGFVKAYGDPLAETTASALDNAKENESFRHEFRLPTRAQLKNQNIQNHSTHSMLI
jgi:hypothetical protein